MYQLEKEDLRVRPFPKTKQMTHTAPTTPMSVSLVIEKFLYKDVV